MKTNHNFLEKILINLFMNFESFKEFLFDVEKFFFLKKNLNQDFKCLFKRSCSIHLSKIFNGLNGSVTCK